MSNIKKKRGAWNFGGNVPKNFIKHIDRSVPFYSVGHEIIKGYSDYFLKNESICYDIGSSTTELLIKLSKYTNKNVNFIGIDNEKKMVEFSKKLVKQKKIKNIKNKYCDVIKLKFLKSDMIVSYYTLQFIIPKYRQTLLNKIYKSLNWGGAFFLFEKIRGSDARFQDMYTNLYHDFKQTNGFSVKEIDEKQKSLRGVMEPFSEKGNIDMLKRAGFVDVSGVFQFLCFRGYLCIK